MPDINYEITAHIATLSTNSRTAWTKELNLVSWNGRETKYDIRDWAPEHAKMGNGCRSSNICNMWHTLTQPFIRQEEKTI